MTELSLRNVTISRGRKLIYSHFSLDIEKSKVIALIAPSGRGKTTLLDFIAGLFSKNDDTTDFSGNVQFAQNCGDRPLISYVFQEDRLVPQLSILQNVMLPLENLMEKVEAKKRALVYLEKTGLEQKINSFPKNLSGGEKQRASLARAFAYPSSILLLDEPFQSQDIRTKSNLIELFLAMQSDEKRTVLFVTHEIREAVKIASRILVLDGNPVKILADISNTPDKNQYYDLSAEGLQTEKVIIEKISS